MYCSAKNNQIKDRNLVKMYNIQIESQGQTINSEKLGIFRSYFSKFKAGSMLNKSGITKSKGSSPLENAFQVKLFHFPPRRFSHLKAHSTAQL